MKKVLNLLIQGHVRGYWAVRKIGVKELLWTLKWHRTYNVSGPWTKAGCVRPGDWLQWLRHFPDY